MRAARSVVAGLGLAIYGVVQAQAGEAASLAVDAEHPVQEVRAALAVLEDPSAVLGVDEVRARDAEFSPATRRTLNPGYSRSAFWARLRLAAGQTPQQRWLVMRTGRLEDVQLWVPAAGGWRHFAAGNGVPHARWPLDAPTASFPLELPGGAPTTVYLRIAGRPALTFDAVLCEPRACERAEQALLGLDAALVGALGLLAAGGLILWGLSRRPLPLLVSSYAVAFGLYELGYQGHAFQYLWPNATHWSGVALNPLVIATFAFQALAIRSLAPPALRPSAVVAGAVLGVQVVLIAISVAGDYRSAGMPALLSILGLAVWMGWVGVQAWRLGAANGRHLAAVGLLTLLGTLPRSLYYLGLLPHSPLTLYASPAVVMVNGVVLMSAVLWGLRELDRQARRTQAALDAAQRRQAERSRLLAYVGHDLRAPLVATVDYLRRLAPTLDAPTRQLQHGIELGVAHQLELVDELVAQARGEAEGLELLSVATYLASLLQDVAAAAAGLADRQGNRLQLRLHADLPALVRLDARRLRQVLLNLLSNSAKFTRDGHIELGASVVSDAAAAPRLRCEVVDDGDGIAADDLPHVFDALWRAERHAAAPGAGLGLAIARQIALAMGGELGATSRPGFGSRFTLELPLQICAPDEFQWPALVGDAPCGFGRGCTALVVDPDAASREHLAELLFAAEFEVLLAADGEAALAAWSAREVHLLITEQDLPGGSGRRLLAPAPAPCDGQGAVRVLYAGRPLRPAAADESERPFDAERQKPLPGEAWWALLEPLFEHRVMRGG